MEEFRPQPVIECHGQGRCNYYDQLASFWLAVIEDDQQFNRPSQQTLKADHTKMISRYIKNWNFQNSFKKALYAKKNSPLSLYLYRCAVCRRIERSKEQRPEPVTHQPPPELVARPEVRRYPQQQPPPPPRRVRVQGGAAQYPNGYPNYRTRQNYPNYQNRRYN